MPMPIFRTVVWLLCVGAVAATVHPTGNSSHGVNGYLVTAEAGALLVRFHTLLPSAAARLTLLAVVLQPLPSPLVAAGWHVQARRNAAAALPSDFDVLVTEAAAVLTAILRRDPRIRGVSLEQRVQRVPLAPIPPPVGAAARRTLQRQHRLPQRAAPGRGPRTELSVTDAIGVQALWAQGVRGAGVRVGIFDTGLGLSQLSHAQRPHFAHVAEQTDWTDDGQGTDGVGHGTFVAGVVASTDPHCPGVAPDAELHIFRVFTDKQVSFTSWFLDAFNYAIHKQLDVVNLSIGGPDFMDEPFVDKVNELTANNIILVSAIGNDGPTFGTLNSPADQGNVLGVGGLDYHDHMAPFSSRGMTLWELPGGYGRFKPDIVTYSVSVAGAALADGCRTLSGTSVASPVITGIVALLASSVPLGERRRLVNTASVKQALGETARRVPAAAITEQGPGTVNLMAAQAFFSTYTPRASVVPPRFDMTDCPYMGAFCQTPVYHGGQPLLVNLTILNGMGVTGRVVAAPSWRPRSAASAGMVDVSVTFSPVLWPWAGWLALHIVAVSAARFFTGTVEGLVVFDVSTGLLTSRVVLPVTIVVAPTPPRERRLLWDQYHSLAYPGGFFPRDDLTYGNSPLDWHGDHPHTNFRTAFTALRTLGYFVEVLGAPLTCFDASQYAALLIVDTEDEFFPAEIAKIQDDVHQRGLALIVIADWYSTTVMSHIRFFDDNTKNWWFPETGGANVPALNDLLRPWRIMLGGDVFSGQLSYQGRVAEFRSGTSVVAFPAGGLLLSTPLRNHGRELVLGEHSTERVPILGFYQVPMKFGFFALLGAHTAPHHSHFAQPTVERSGRIAVYGDSSCLDDVSSAGRERCMWILQAMLDYVLTGTLELLSAVARPLTSDYRVSAQAPYRAEASTLHLYSAVLTHHLGWRQVLARPGIFNALPACPHGKAHALRPFASDDVEYQSLLTMARNHSVDSAVLLLSPYARHVRQQFDLQGAGVPDDVRAVMWLWPVAVAICGTLAGVWWLCAARCRPRRRVIRFVEHRTARSHVI